MAKNKLKDVRDHLFETLERLTDKNDPIEVQRAIAISKVASVIIESAKLELDAVNVLGQAAMPSEFIGVSGDSEKQKALTNGGKKVYG